MTRDDLLAVWGERLKRIREDKGLSVIDVAKQTGLHRSTLYRFEEGAMEPSVVVRSHLAAVLDFDPDDVWNHRTEAAS